MKQKNIVNLLLVLLILALAIAAYFFWKQHQTKQEVKEMVEMMTFEKEQLEEEYEDLAFQFDGYGKEIHNDSLADLLYKEKQRVQDLLEELRITKVTNARRIAELKKELATVRAVMVDYVHQIDSLDRTNKRLVTENQQVRRQYEEVSQKATQLEQERQQLTEVVNRASMMEITNFELTKLNKNGRKTSQYSKIQKLQFTFDILKNITVQPGEKVLYMRILRPDGEVMQKRITDTFTYENKDIPYSLCQTFEYEGETMSETLYWNVEEILQAGTYNADFFIDGNLIGSFPFNIQK